MINAPDRDDPSARLLAVPTPMPERPATTCFRWRSRDCGREVQTLAILCSRARGIGALLANFRTVLQYRSPRDCISRYVVRRKVHLSDLVILLIAISRSVPSCRPIRAIAVPADALLLPINYLLRERASSGRRDARGWPAYSWHAATTGRRRCVRS